MFHGFATQIWVNVLLFLFQITQHYSKPRVTPVEVLPVFPDFKVSYNFIMNIDFWSHSG